MARLCLTVRQPGRPVRPRQQREAAPGRCLWLAVLHLLLSPLAQAGWQGALLPPPAYPACCCCCAACTPAAEARRCASNGSVWVA
jgi:hypothetical protein